MKKKELPYGSHSATACHHTPDGRKGFKNTTKGISVLLFSVTLLLWGFQAKAQDNQPHSTDLYELDLDQLGKIVITAGKTPQQVSEITQKVDIVTQKQMEQIIQGKRNIAELIQYLPGASVKALSRNDASWGAYGGIGPKYSTYMLQGLPIDGFVDPMSMESMAFQRIEVQRGPASVLYPNYLSQDFAGNQCPLAGTINLIPKENISAPRSMFSLHYGSYQTINGQLYHEQKFGKTKAFAGCSYEKSNYTNYGSTGSWLNMQKNPEYQKGKVILGVSASVDQAEKHKISLFGNYTFHQGDVGRINREYNNNYGLINVSYSGELSKPVSISFKAGLRTYDRSWQEDHFSSNNDPSLRETDGVKQTIIPLDFSLSYSHLGKGKLIVGADHQQSNYRTTSQLVNQGKITGNDASASQTGLYFQEELSFGKLIVRGGGRYNIIGYDIKKLSGSTPGLSHRSWNVFLWSAGIKYHLTEEWSVFTNAGSSFMSPGLKSMGGTLSENDRLVSGKNGQLPNPNLNPEKGIGFDLGIEGKLLQSIDLSLRAFSNQIKNAIIDNVVSQNPSQTMSVNTDGKTDVKGFEIGASQPIGNHFEWFANITFSDSKINDPTNPDQDGAEVPFVPRVMGNAGFSLSLPFSIEITPMAHWGGKIYDSSSKASRTAFSSKELINVKVVKNFSAKNKSNFSLFADIYNLTNNRFEMPWQFRDPGLSFMLGATFEF